MKNLFIFLSILLLTSCATVRPSKQIDDAQKQIIKKENKVFSTLDRIEDVEKNKQIQTSTLALGIEYSLSQITNPPIQVITAQSLNERIVSIVGSPHIEESKKIKEIVDLLNSELSKERNKGQKLLSKKDEEIDKLQKQKSALKKLYDVQLWDLSDEAKRIAQQADENQATLDQMSGFFGLNAVFWGLKKFIFSSLTWIVVFLLIFAVLRVLSNTNPIAAAAFAVFDGVSSVIINILKTLTPKAFNIAKLNDVSETLHIKQTLTKVVNSIQETKEKQKINSNSSTDIKEVLTKLKGDMDQSEKDLINKILTEEKWK